MRADPHSDEHIGMRIARHRGVILSEGMTAGCLHALARLLNDHTREDCEDSNAEGAVSPDMVTNAAAADEMRITLLHRLEMRVKSRCNWIPVDTGRAGCLRGK